MVINTWLTHHPDVKKAFNGTPLIYEVFFRLYTSFSSAQAVNVEDKPIPLEPGSTESIPQLRWGIGDSISSNLAQGVSPRPQGQKNLLNDVKTIGIVNYLQNWEPRNHGIILANWRFLKKAVPLNHVF